MDLGVSATEFGDVSLESRCIKPAKHLVELPAEDKPDQRERQLPESHRLAEYPTEHFGGFAIRQLAPCNFQFKADEISRALKRQRRKCADVVGSDRLIRFVGANGVQELALQDSDFHLVDVIVFHERNRPE